MLGTIAREELPSPAEEAAYQLTENWTQSGNATVALARFRSEVSHADLRLIAADAIGLISPSESVEILLSMVVRTPAHDHSLTLQALDRVAPNWSKTDECRAALPMTIEALGIANPESRNTIVTILARIQSPRVVDPLFVLLEHDEQVREAAARALVGMRHPTVLPALLQRLKHPNKQVRDAVRHALATLDFPWRDTEAAAAVGEAGSAPLDTRGPHGADWERCHPPRSSFCL